MRLKRSPHADEGGDRSLAIEIVRLLPNFLWFGFAVVVAILAYKPLIDRLDNGEISKVSLFSSIQIEFVKTQIEKSAREAGANNKNPVPPNFAAYLDRIQRSASKLAGARALWVDDESPISQFEERRALAALGIEFDTTKTNDEAKQLLEMADDANVPYDFIISDIGKESDPPLNGALCFPLSAKSPNAGCELVKIVRARYPDRSPPPIIFYSREGDSHGIPPGVLGAADRFDKLVTLVLDAVERRSEPVKQEKAKQ